MSDYVKIKPLVENNDTIESFCQTLRSLIADAYVERDRFSHIAATIRINALHYGATDAEVASMLSGEINFISWVADKLEASVIPAHPPEVLALVEAARRAAHATTNDGITGRIYTDEAVALQRASPRSRKERPMSDNPLAALAMRDRAASELDSDAADLKADASRFRSGTDPHHGRMAFAEAAERQSGRIRALPTTFTDAELLDAAMQLPAVRALVEAATIALDFIDWSLDTDEGDNGCPPQFIDGITALRAALAPFRK